MGERPIRLTVVVAALLVAMAAALHAHPSAQDLPTFYALICGTTAAAELRRMRDERADGRDTRALIERGLITLRLAELVGDDRERERGLDLFERALRLDASAAWGHFGLALALSRAPELRVALLGNLALVRAFAEAAGMDPVSRARRALRQALELEPAFTEAAELFARLAIAGGESEHLRAAAAALALAAEGRRYPELHLLRAEVLLALHDPAGAESAAELALSLGIGAPALRLRGLARLALPDQATAGWSDYLAAAADADTAIGRALMEDLLPVSAAAEAAELERLDPADRSEWLRRLWLRRAAAAGVSPEERVAEHFRRLARAATDYRRTGMRRAPPSGALLASFADHRLRFDDRGLIYVRHGEPIEVVRTITYGVRPNETWIYPREGGYTLLHFVALEGGQDFMLVSDLLTALEDGTDDGVMRLFGDRALFEPRYYMLAERYRTARSGRTDLQVRDVIMDQRPISAEIAYNALRLLENDSYGPRFDQDVPFYYDLYRFIGDGGLTEVTVALAVPGDRLQPLELPDGELGYALRISLVLLDTLSGELTRFDTVQAFRTSQPIVRGEYLRTHITVQAPPSTSTVHRLVLRNDSEPGHGRSYGGPTVVTDFSGRALGMSDIVLAEQDTGAWRRGSISLGLVPPSQFTAGQPLTVFYEVYNLPSATRYATEIEVRPARLGLFARIRRAIGLGRAAIHVRFEGDAQPDTAGRLQEARRVTSDLGAGRYEMLVTVTNLLTGESTHSSRHFLITRE